MLAMFTSAEGADVVDVLTAHAALPLLLKGLFLEDVGLSLPPLHTHAKTHTREDEIHTVRNSIHDQTWKRSLWSCVLSETMKKSQLDFNPRV